MLVNKRKFKREVKFSEGKIGSFIFCIFEFLDCDFICNGVYYYYRGIMCLDFFSFFCLLDYEEVF